MTGNELTVDEFFGSNQYKHLAWIIPIFFVSMIFLTGSDYTNWIFRGDWLK